MNTNETMPVLGRCKHKDCEYALFSDAKDIRAAGNLNDVVPGAAYRMTDRGNLLARCPHGHKVFRLYQVEGEFDPNVKCDGRCEHAKGRKCVCACGGMNHGRGHAGTVENVSEADEVVDGELVEPRPVYDPDEHGEHKPPTDSQIAFVIVLATERGVEIDESKLRSMERLDVSDYIDRLKATPKRPRDEYVPADADGWGQLVEKVKDDEAQVGGPVLMEYEGDEAEVAQKIEQDALFGEVGDTIRGKALVTHEQDVNDATLMLFRACIDGKFGTLKWFKPSYINVNYAKGDTVTFKAKVKRHETSHGNVTMVTYFEGTPELTE